MEYFNDFAVVDGFHVQPGFFRFQLDGTDYFSSGMQCYKHLKAYYLDKDTDQYCEVWLDPAEHPIAEVLAERDENERYSKFQQSLGIETGFTDYCFLDDRRKEKQVFESLIGKFGLTPKECAYIAEYIVSEEITPEIKEITDPDEFAEELTLTNYGTYHSWAGSHGHTEKGTVLIGDLEWGKSLSTCDQHDGNGDPHYEESYKRPNFDITKKAVVHIFTEIWDHYNNNDQEENTDHIVIYNPAESSIKELTTTAQDAIELIEASRKESQ